MDELHDCRKLYVHVAVVAQRTCREHDDLGTHTLAAAGDDVLGDLVDENDVGGEPSPNRTIDGCNVLPDESLNRGKVYDRSCSCGCCHGVGGGNGRG